MAEILEDTSSALESTTVGIYRTAATVKGGRRFSFGALVVVGDRSGRVGIGYGKANQVPSGIEKAQKEAKRRMQLFPLQDKTIPHQVEGRFGSCRVRLVPASPGTGVIAGASVRAVLEMVGIQDCLTKCFGSNNPKNRVKATMDALEQLRNRETIMELRGVDLPETSVEVAIKKGMAFMPTESGGEKAVAPVNTVGEERRGGRGGGRRGGGGGGGRRGGERPAEQKEAAPAAEQAPAEQAPAADPPASEGGTEESS
ncbi:MAG: 30S ribosomal protein S5 [Phycisphaerae bacterium]|nr:30S ribosomal protein S5 [Phycisphaerae bacterium]